MSHDITPTAPIPQALIKKKSALSLVWLLPIIAACIGGWLVYKSIIEADIAITIHFASGEGLVAGKTEVRYQGMSIGLVDKITLEENLDGVIANVSIDRLARKTLTTGTQFWLVKPEVSFGGIKGLDTLLSGNYIALKPVKAAEGTETTEQKDFVALSTAPPLDDKQAGLSLTLTAKDLGSLHIGSPVNYRKITVGEVASYQLSADQQQVAIKIHIDTEHAQLVRSNSHFWNSSGITLSGSFPYLKLNTGSLASLVAGGISFDTPKHEAPQTVSQGNDSFTLFEDYEAAQAGIRVLVEFSSADGLEPGRTKVRYKGLNIATVKNVQPKPDFTGVVAEVVFDPQASFALNTSTRFWLVQPKVSLSEISGLDTLISGSYLEIDFNENQAATDTEEKYSFVALHSAPSLDYSKPGRHLKLKADSLGGLNRGSEIYFRRIAIGKVQNYALHPSQEYVELDIFIDPKYSHLVNRRSRFYQNSGIKISGGLNGLELQTESLAALIRGGIGLYNPNNSWKTTDHKINHKKESKHKQRHNKPISNGRLFHLHPNLDSAMDQGPAITIRFNNGDDIKPGTQIKYKGISVGSVDSVGLDRESAEVVVTATLIPSARKMAKEGSQFWVSKAELGLSKSTNLGTLISGAYISIQPGIGESTHDFKGLSTEPSTLQQSSGLQLVLKARNLGAIKQGVPVYYRNIPVGTVTGFSLGKTAQHVNINVNIEPPFSKLVRSGSKFWNISGIDIDAGLFKGIKIRTDSLESILAGGVAFATPEDGKALGESASFKLHEEPKKEWLQWQPDLSQAPKAESITPQTIEAKPK